MTIPVPCYTVTGQTISVGINAQSYRLSTGQDMTAVVLGDVDKPGRREVIPVQGLEPDSILTAATIITNAAGHPVLVPAPLPDPADSALVLVTQDPIPYTDLTFLGFPADWEVRRAPLGDPLDDADLEQLHQAGVTTLAGQYDKFARPIHAPQIPCPYTIYVTTRRPMPTAIGIGRRITDATPAYYSEEGLFLLRRGEILGFTADHQLNWLSLSPQGQPIILSQYDLERGLITPPWD